MVRIFLLAVFVLVGLASARTLDGRVKDSVDRQGPHGLDEGYSSGKNDLTECKDCVKETEKDLRDIQVPDDDDITKHELPRIDTTNKNRRSHRRKSRRNRKSKNPRRKHLRKSHKKTAASDNGVDVDVSRPSKKLTQKQGVESKHTPNGDQRDNVVVHSQKTITVSNIKGNEKHNGNSIDINKEDNTNTKARKVVSGYKSGSEKKPAKQEHPTDVETGLITDDENEAIQNDKGKGNNKKHRTRTDKTPTLIKKDAVPIPENITSNTQLGEEPKSNTSNEELEIIKNENNKDNNDENAKHQSASKKEPKSRANPPKNKGKQIIGQDGSLKDVSEGNNQDDGDGKHTLLTDLKKGMQKPNSSQGKNQSGKQNKKKETKNMTRNKNRKLVEQSGTSKTKSRKSRIRSRSKQNAKNVPKKSPAKQKFLDIAAAPPQDSDDRWSRRGLDQVPDVERLERRLHPKVEAPVDDIIRTLQKVLGDVRHSIFQAEYNYKHTFNTTRWSIMTGVREELMNIAKENDGVYDAIMEVSLHTKELYLRAHQRRKLSQPHALTASGTNGMRDIDLRSKYSYARDEMRSAQLLKRRIMGLERKRGSLSYDYVELTRKILERLPTRELYDLGRRANQTIQTLEYSKAMRDSIDKAHLYRHSQTSTFLDMRSARNHINDATDIIASVKKQYMSNQVKAKEIRRAQQNRHDIRTMGFDMSHMEQWAKVDMAKSHANDLFATAAMTLMKIKPLLKASNAVITAIKDGTQESKFERTLRNIREKIPMLNFTIFAIKSDVCTDEYEACIVRVEEVKELDLDIELDRTYVEKDSDIDETVDESSGETTDHGNTDLIDETSGHGEFIDESSGDGSEIPTEIEIDEIDTTTTAPTGTGDTHTVTTTNPTKPTKGMPIDLADTDDEDIIEDIKRARQTSTHAPLSTKSITDAHKAKESTTKSQVKTTKTTPKPVTATTITPKPVQATTTTPKPVKATTTTHAPVKSTTTTHKPVTSTTTTHKPVKATTTTQTPVKSTVTTKVPLIGLSDSDDEDIIEEMEKAKTTTQTPALTTTTTPTTKPVSTTEEDQWYDWFGFQADQIFNWNTRHKRDAGDGEEVALLNETLSELIQEHLRNRSEVNEGWLDKAKLRRQSVNELQEHFNKVQSQIHTFENRTLKVKSFLSKWRAKAAEARAVHDRVTDVSKDIDFKFEVLREQNGKAVKQAEAKLTRMQEAYESNKDRINDDNSPETAKQAIELAKTLKDNLLEIVSLKKLHPAPCKKLQTMDTLIRANISELQHKIKQAKLIAASLQVAVKLEGKSHLEVPVPNIDTTKQARMEVEMTVKPHSDQGAIATVQTNDTGAIVISMKDYYPKLTLLDSGIYNIEEKTGDIPLHNDTWYRLRLERFATDYNLTVYNGTVMVQSFLTKVDRDDYPTVYNQPSAVYVGGASDDYDLDSWRGCIGNIKVNDEYLNLLRADSTNKIPKSSTVLSKTMVEKRSLVLDGFGHAFYVLDRRQQRARFQTFSAIFTPQSDGMVFTVNAENNRLKTAAVIKDRRLLVSVQHHNKPTQFVSVTDVIGVQQRVEISSRGRSITVTLNGNTGDLKSTKEKVDIVNLQMDGVHVGTTSNKTESIRGCIHGITINAEDIQLYSMLDATSVTYGSCEQSNCVTFKNTSKAVQLPNTTLADTIAVVLTYGSVGSVLQYSKGKKFNLKISIDQDRLNINETIKENTQTIDLSDYNFKAGDEVVAMVTDADKQLTVVVGEESEGLSYGGGGGWLWFADDEEDDGGGDDDGIYIVRVGPAEDQSTDKSSFVGNLVTLKVQNSIVDLSPYIETHGLQRCTSPKRQRQKVSPPPKQQRQLTC